jgi:D-alanine-D-alanine ligase-like ATP-grasp enzyme
LGWKISYTGGAPQIVVSEARKAMQALELDFGAVDVLYSPEGGVWVLEVNTCPGLDSGTLQRYVDAFVELGEVD